MLAQTDNLDGIKVALYKYGTDPSVLDHCICGHATKRDLPLDTDTYTKIIKVTNPDGDWMFFGEKGQHSWVQLKHDPFTDEFVAPCNEYYFLDIVP